MSKRGNNEGSVYQRKDGRWVGQMQIGYKPDGTRKFVNYYGRTRREVANKLSDSLAQFNHGIFVEPSNITYADWMKYWVKNFRKSYIRGTTYARYISFLDVHILPELGNLKLQNIKSTHIQKFYNKLTDSGMSPASIKHLHSILRQSFAEAIIEKYMVQNPCDFVTRPRVVYKQVTVFTPEQQKQFVETLDNTPICLIIKLALGTGARIGELFGLDWNHVDFENKCIHIEQNVTRYVEYDDTTNEHHTVCKLSTLKTDSSHRMVPLTDSLIQALQEYKVKQFKYIRVPKKKIEHPELLFLNENGKLMEYSAFRRRYSNVLKRAGLPFIKIHALRHTFATRVLEANIHPKIAQELLGHSTASITLDIYSHVLPEQKYEAIRKLEGII